VRELLLRVTALLAVLTVAIVAWINVLNAAPWPLVFARAAVSLGIVVASAVGIGFVVMRTSLRRHYEAWLRHSRGPSAGAER
jgi:hypothetical protein